MKTQDFWPVVKQNPWGWRNQQVWGLNSQPIFLRDSKSTLRKHLPKRWTAGIWEYDPAGSSEHHLNQTTIIFRFKLLIFRGV